MRLKVFCKSNLPCLLVILFVLSQFGILGLVFSSEIRWEALTKLGQAALERNDLKKAQVNLENALELAKSFQPQDGRLPFSLYLLANVNLRLGQKELCIDNLSQGLKWLETHEASEDLLAGVIQSQLATVYLQKNEPAAALEKARLALKIFKRQTEIDFQPNLYALVTFGEALAALDKNKESAAGLEEALEAIESLAKPSPTSNYLIGRVKRKLKSLETKKSSLKSAF